MKRAWLGDLTPVSRLLFFFLLVIATFGAVFLAGTLLAGPLFGIRAAQLPAILADPDNPGSLTVLKYFQVLQSFGLFIIPPLLAGFFFERSGIRFLTLDRSPKWPLYLLVILSFVVMIPLVNAMIDWNESLVLPASLSSLEQWMQETEAQAAKLTEAFMETGSPAGFLLNLCIIAVLPAFGEEFLFRGVLQRLLKEWTRNIHAAIFISALAFSAMHLQFYGLLPRFFLGVVFGYMFWWTGSLWVPIFAHFLNNATAVVFELLVSQGKATEDAGSFGSDSPFMILLSTVLSALVLLAVYRAGMASRTIDRNETGGPQ